MLLVIDNYDSFTYNLVQRLGEMDPNIELEVHRNDKITVDEIAGKKPSHIIISPGPCTPKEAGISNDVLLRFAPKVPILGVCLGHQCIGHSFGGVVGDYTQHHLSEVHETRRCQGTNKCESRPSDERIYDTASARTIVITSGGTGFEVDCERAAGC